MKTVQSKCVASNEVPISHSVQEDLEYERPKAEHGKESDTWQFPQIDSFMRCKGELSCKKIISRMSSGRVRFGTITIDIQLSRKHFAASESKTDHVQNFVQQSALRHGYHQMSIKETTQWLDSAQSVNHFLLVLRFQLLFCFYHHFFWRDSEIPISFFFFSSFFNLQARATSDRSCQLRDKCDSVHCICCTREKPREISTSHSENPN